MSGKPIIIADDHPLFRAALRQAIAGAAPDRDVVETESVATASDALRSQDAGLLCLDLHMPDSDGFAGLIAVKQEFPALPVVVVSGTEEPGVAARAVTFGAAGFIPKSSSVEVIGEAIQAILDGDVWTPAGADDDDPEAAAAAGRLASLTPTQLKVLLFVKAGLLNKQIAYEMAVSEATVKAHMTAIMRKLNVQTRTQAVLAAAPLAVEPDGLTSD